jgi:hypothetical protein
VATAIEVPVAAGLGDGLEAAVVGEVPPHAAASSVIAATAVVKRAFECMR